MDFLKITEETWYGKPLGGCCYAGIPMDKIIRIQLSDQVRLELNMYMFITEDLSYDVRFDWGSAPDWKSCHYIYKRTTFQDKVQEISTWTEKDWTDNSFIDISIDNDHETEVFLRIGPVRIHVTDNKVLIMDFLERFKVLLNKLLGETEELYHKQKYIIGW